jgi:hypothetical protein
LGDGPGSVQSMRTFNQLHPIASSILAFKVRPGAESELESSLKKEIMIVAGTRVEVTARAGWNVLEISKEVSPGAERNAQISPDLYRTRLDELGPMAKKAREVIGRSTADGTSIYEATILTCGTRDSAWLKNYSDISYLYKERGGPQGTSSIQGEVYQTNIAYLNRILGFQGKILVNRFNSNGIQGMLYVHGGAPSLSKDNPCIMVEVDMDQVQVVESYRSPALVIKATSPYSEKGDAGSETPVKQDLNALIAIIKGMVLDVILMECSIGDLINGDLTALKGKGNSLLDELSTIQNNINEHMKGYGSGREAKAAADKETYDREKRLLVEASVHFSLVSEIENGIMRAHARMTGMKETVRGQAVSMMLEHDHRSTDDVKMTIAEHTARRIEAEIVSLRDISEELTRSRAILTSTIEVLRTFLETRQREVSEKMSRLINILFLVFACFGLADALGNFVILILEYGFLGSDPSLGKVLSVTSLGLILTLTPLLVSAGLLYIYFQRR